MANAKEPMSHKRGKHIEIKYNLVRKIVQRGDVTVCKMTSPNNLADPFKKTLPQKSFDSHLEGFWMSDMTHML